MRAVRRLRLHSLTVFMWYCRNLLIYHYMKWKLFHYLTSRRNGRSLSVHTLCGSPLNYMFQNLCVKKQ